jgi:putative transport protein
MEIDLYKLMSSNGALLLFIALGMGYLIGNIKIGSIEIGSTTGVLFSGLLLGHFGFKAPPGVGSIGFVLFYLLCGSSGGASIFWCLS